METLKDFECVDNGLERNCRTYCKGRADANCTKLIFRNPYRKKKAQIWYLDAIMGLLIFGITIIIFYKSFVSRSWQQESDLDMLLEDAKTISSSLLSAGYPLNWNNDTIQKIGLTGNNQRINNTRLDYFIDLPYNKTRTLLGTKYDYYVFFEYKNLSIIPLNKTINNSGIIGYKDDNVESQVRIARIAIKDSDIVRMIVQVWK